ncbi:hypothetical protein E2C01_070224 [Portunus trituberculatus]|uniref:Uncharacterized protein n=1 Tax=Portunus trituberculatus TaxID=210409 RepID=A0A5B7I2Y9_PORTR|nr:hypothetical protein [Portunus trituberculatus]
MIQERISRRAFALTGNHHARQGYRGIIPPRSGALSCIKVKARHVNHTTPATTTGLYSPLPSTTTLLPSFLGFSFPRLTFASPPSPPTCYNFINPSAGGGGGAHTSAVYHNSGGSGSRGACHLASPLTCEDALINISRPSALHSCYPARTGPPRPGLLTWVCVGGVLERGLEFVRPPEYTRNVSASLNVASD